MHMDRLLNVIISLVSVSLDLCIDEVKYFQPDS